MNRLTPARVTMIMFGVVGCLIAAYIAKGLFAKEAPPPPRRPATRNVPMAIGDLKPGTIITENHLGLGPFPASEVDSDMLLTNRVIVGRVVKTPIKAASPIRAEQLYEPGGRPPLNLAAGMRAVAFKVKDGAAIVDGLIKPDDYVDVHMTVTELNNDDRLQGGLTIKLFEGVRVITINRNYMQADIDLVNNSVTLELTPEQANIAFIAREKGEITLAYNPEGPGTGGVAVADSNRATLEEILGLKPKVEPEPPQPPFVSEIIRGSSVQRLQYRNGHMVGGYSFDQDPRKIVQPPNPPLIPDPTSTDPNAPNQPVPNQLVPTQQIPNFNNPGSPYPPSAVRRGPANNATPPSV